MNVKKIWVLAIIFGMVMSVFFYMITANNSKTNVKVASSNEVTAETPKTEPKQEELDPTKLPIEAGKRAISMAVNEVQSVSGFISPGSYVDVIAVLPLPANEKTASQIFLENIKVLAVGKTIVLQEGEAQEPYQMVTLEVSPSEGATLAMAKEIGVITLMLRGNDDHKLTPDISTSLQQLIEGKMSK
jgi:pilus assembly protein CpaB